MKYILTATFILFSFFLIAQNDKESTPKQSQNIEIKSSFTSYKFIENGERISRKDLLKKLENNEAAFNLLKKSNTGNTFYIISSIIGGGLIGIPLGDYVAGRPSPNWTLAYIGGGFSVISIPLFFKSIKNAKKAIALYNTPLETVTENKFNPKLHFNINPQCALLALSF